MMYSLIIIFYVTNAAGNLQQSAEIVQQYATNQACEAAKDYQQSHIKMPHLARCEIG